MTEDRIDAVPHHIGCAVEDLDASCATYAGTFGLIRRTRPIAVASQHVRVCFVELANGFFLELVSPLDDQARLSPFLRVGFYHLCFLVDDLQAARERLRAQRFLAFPEFASEAFAGGRCQFFLSAQKHLIELAEMPPQDFGGFFSANLHPGSLTRQDALRALR